MDNQSSFERVRDRMEEIVVQIRSKDLPLEKSLDLYEEALRLGSVAAEMIDRTDFSVDELGQTSPNDDGSEPVGSSDGEPEPVASDGDVDCQADDVDGAASGDAQAVQGDAQAVQGDAQAVQDS
ncbi:MAG: exodeoxyribonuclease VII small subunit [Actinomycetia bacterium]|nr:exodeoxyribonuclease VII small subunit [Actinomycetes bacterium]